MFPKDEARSRPSTRRAPESVVLAADGPEQIRTSPFRQAVRPVPGQAPVGSAPEPLRIVYRGQVYRLVGTEAHQRRDGRLTILAEWGSHCAECGEEFTFRQSGRAFAPNRRCRLHRLPGVRVRQISAPVGGLARGEG